MPRVVIVGGGLAGMTVARTLRERGQDVVLLEAESRLGGKAAADRDPRTGDWIEHGYHVFPGWYRNVRRLLEEIGASRHLIDIHHVHYLAPGSGGRTLPVFELAYTWAFLPNLVRNLWSGIAPAPVVMLWFYSILDLANAPFSARSFLDRVSANGFLRGQWLATEDVARLQQHTVLQASSIPSYELSAMTLQRVARAWMRVPRPFFSILDGNLQERFIDPLNENLRRLGVEIALEKRIVSLEIRDGRLGAVRLASGERIGSPEDRFVLATPLEVTREMVDADVVALETNDPPQHKKLADLNRLETAPMAALQLRLRRTVDLPTEHVILYDSEYLTSFIDVTKHWKLDRTTLCVIASNFQPLRSLCRTDEDIQPVSEPAAQFVIEELLRYLPQIRRGDIDVARSWFRPNVRWPLFLNTAGAWPFRPLARTRIPNLFVAGDYCQTEADLTTMESAVQSGLATAGEVLRDLGRVDAPEILDLGTAEGLDPRTSYPRLPLRVAQWGFFLPLAFLARGWHLAGGWLSTGARDAPARG